jgi:hypothetical protein
MQVSIGCSSGESGLIVGVTFVWDSGIGAVFVVVRNLIDGAVGRK